jgi:hypothetical protein
VNRARGSVGSGVLAGMDEQDGDGNDCILRSINTFLAKPRSWPFLPSTTAGSIGSMSRSSHQQHLSFERQANAQSARIGKNSREKIV